MPKTIDFFKFQGNYYLVKISNDIKILIVEDDPVQAQILQDKLLTFNKEYNLQWYKSGEELISYLENGYQKHRYSYIILDYFLQTTENKDAINGFEVINKLKQVSPKSKIILYSAFESDADKKFESIKEEPNVIDIVKKSDFSYSSLQNIIRFNYSQLSLNLKKKRLQLFSLFYLLVCILAFVYFFSTNFFG